MKKQLSLITRSLLLSGVAAAMLSSCMFMPPKEKVENKKETETVAADEGESQTDGSGTETGNGSDSGSGNGTGSGSGTESGNDTETVVQTKHGLTLVWNDEFDYTGVPDTSKWKYQIGNDGWGNHELQNYISNKTTAKTAVVEDNMLKIKAYKEGDEWKSARLNTKDHWKYGYIEARLKVTDRKGAWPAFWMMPQDSVYGTWPNSGEIDIMENAPSTCGNHKAFSTLHAEGHWGGDGASIGAKVFGEEFSSEWHTFGVLWTEDKITSFYDDKEKGSYSNDGTSKNWPYDKDFYIILNLAIGGDLGGTGDVGKLNGNAEFLVDYVRVYQ